MSEKEERIYLSSELAIVFLVLKLTHSVDWSWWIVLMPIWLFPLKVLFGISVAAWQEHRKANGP